MQESALDAALKELLRTDPIRAIRALTALSPNKMMEAIKNEMAELGITVEDLVEMRRKLEGPNHLH
jgi:hypothetical protein